MVRKKKKKKHKKLEPQVDLHSRLQRAIQSRDSRSLMSMLPLLKQLMAISAKNEESIVDILQERIASLERQRLFQEALDSYRQMAAFFPQAQYPHWEVKLCLQTKEIGQALSIAAQLIKNGREEDIADSIDQLGDYLVVMKDQRQLFPENFSFFADLPLIDASLQAYDKDDRTEVARLLNGIGYHSPYRHWKMLLKGIMAFDAGDDEKAQLCFSKCDQLPLSDLAAFYNCRIQLSQGRLPKSPSPHWRKWLPELSAPEQQFFFQIKELRQKLAKDNIRESMDAIKNILDQGDDQSCLHDRLYLIGKSHILQEAPDKWYKWLEALQKLLWDDANDCGHLRFKALCCERLQNWEYANEWWNLFLQSFRSTRLFAKEDADLAHAQVLRRMAQNAEKCPHEGDFPMPFMSFRSRSRKKRPIDYLKESLKYDPYHRDSHRQILEYTRMADYHSSVVKSVVQNWLKYLPEDITGLLEAADIYLADKKYQKALSYLKQALAIEPFNRHIKKKMVYVLIRSGRDRTRRKKIRVARLDFQRALAIDSELGEPADTLCKWGAMEFAAGNYARGHELFVQAFATGLGKGYLCFLILLEMKRFRVADYLATPYAQEFFVRMPQQFGQEELIKIFELATIYDMAIEEEEVNDLARLYLLELVALIDTKQLSIKELLAMARYLIKVGEYEDAGRVAMEGKRKSPSSYHFLLYIVLSKVSGRITAIRRTDAEQLQRIEQYARNSNDQKTVAFIQNTLQLYEVFNCMNPLARLLHGADDDEHDPLRFLIDRFLFQS